MKRVLSYSIVVLLIIISCSPNNNCPSEQIKTYLIKYFDIIEQILLANYMGKESIEDAAENSILMMSYRSDFQHILELPECAITHHESALKLINLLIDEMLNENKDLTISNEIEEELLILNNLTEELLSKVENDNSKEGLYSKFREAITIQERAKVYFNKDEKKNEPTDEQKEEIIMNFINDRLEEDPGMILHDYIDYIGLKVVDRDIAFYVNKEIGSDEDFEKVFTSLFFAALVNSTDSENNFVWNVSTIGVFFYDKEGNWIDIFMEDDDFQKFYKNPEDLFLIVRKHTSLD